MLNMSVTSELFWVLAVVAIPFYAISVAIVLRYRANRGKDLNAATGIKRLVKDLSKARHHVVIVCKSCSLGNGDEATIEPVKDILTKKAAEGVEIKLIISSKPLKFLEELAAKEVPVGTGTRHVLKIQRVPGPLLWTGRVIDGRIVERHTNGEMLFARGEFLRSENAEDVATELNRLLPQLI